MLALVSQHVRIALCTVLLLVAGRAWGQTAIVTGAIHDAKTGEELLGANVLLVGTSLGASADLDGNYTIRGVPPGTYSLRVSYVGYAPKVVDGVALKAGETTVLNVSLGQAVEEAKEEVVVTAERVRSTEAAVLSRAPEIGHHR